MLAIEVFLVQLEQIAISFGLLLLLIPIVVLFLTQVVAQNKTIMNFLSSFFPLAILALIAMVVVLLLK